MTEDQRQAALEALDTIAEWANECRSVYVPDIAAHKTRVLEGLQSPPVPAIEGLEEATNYLIRLGDYAASQAGLYRRIGEDSVCDTLKVKSDWIRTCVKAAHAYAELQKGE